MYYYYHPCFADKEMEAQRDEITCPKVIQLVSNTAGIGTQLL